MKCFKFSLLILAVGSLFIVNLASAIDGNLDLQESPDHIDVDASNLLFIAEIASQTQQRLAEQIVLAAQQNPALIVICDGTGLDKQVDDERVAADEIATCLSQRGLSTQAHDLMSEFFKDSSQLGLSPMPANSAIRFEVNDSVMQLVVVVPVVSRSCIVSNFVDFSKLIDTIHRTPCWNAL